MISCPKCNASLPDWVKTCQFCQTDVAKVARPVSAPERPRVQRKGWVWGAYYALAAYWMLNGIYSIAIGLYPLLKHSSGDEGMFAIAAVIGIVIGAVTFLVGLGLVLHIELARGVVNFLAGLKIIFGLFGLAGSVLGSMFAGPLAFVMIVAQIIDIGAAAFMIYLIGETETRAPNL